MGKSGRHKKLNRAEKAKTQLKGGGVKKKLGKAANVVNPTLRVKRIVIREQLTSAPNQHEDVAITRRHQTLSELLSTLHHHNTNLRKDALLGLLEIVTGQNNLIFLKRNLDKILERVAALTSDLEGIVRRENLKVAEAIFQRIEEHEIQPYWNLLLTHLQCTLTHLNPTVRYSTLPFFHLLVGYFPNLVALSGQTLLPSFLSLISSAATTSAAGDQQTPLAGTTTGSHLRVEISGRKDQVQERLKVFVLIDTCLQLRREKYVQKMGEIHCQAQQLTFSSEGNENYVRPRFNLDRNLATTEEKIDIFSPNTDITAGFVGQHEMISYSSATSNNPTRQLLYSCGYGSTTPTTAEATSSPSLSEIMSEGSSPVRNHNVTGSLQDGENGFWPIFAQSCLSCLTETWIESCPSAPAASSLVLASNTLKLPSGVKGSDKEKTKKLRDGKQGRFLDPTGRRLPEVSSAKNSNSMMTSSSVNLSPACVDTLKIIVNVMVQIVMPAIATQTKVAGSSSSMMDDRDKSDKSRNDFIQLVGATKGADLKKHFFSNLPFVSIHDSNKQAVTTINLNLFCLAAQLGLVDAERMARFENLINELIQGGSLDSEQIQLILRFLSCVQPNLNTMALEGKTRHKMRRMNGGLGGDERMQLEASSLSTDFICCVLSSKDHRREICKYLQRILRPDNTNLEEMALIKSLNWDVVTIKLFSSFSRISFKWLNLLTHISIRRLGKIKRQLLDKMEWFQVQLNSPSTSIAIWNESVRLFWYACALSEFKNEFQESILLPQSVRDSIESLERRDIEG
ncbi:uncharacterized protein LOC110852823 [Folsomia candida]|uniref:uncharacterized protein LOC110852823 n=1 Tax=Folsomia candida TaxID=158441 RepID=UPI000B8F682B|nr:uncharacterized protein LOC110852823 [Folsomia candida]